MLYLRSLFLIILFSICLLWSKDKVNDLQSRDNLSFDEEKIILSLPRIKTVQSITLGYEHFVSTILWFRTLHYFGSKFEAKEKMPWFSHMCELVTELDPRARHVFESCATLMSWIAREPKRTILLLSKGITHDDDYWRYYYLRGFVYWYFLEEFDHAQADFKYGSRLKDSPVFLSSLASRLMSHGNDIGSAISFLQTAIEQSADEMSRVALEERLMLAYVSRDIFYIEMAYEKYISDFNLKPESIHVLVEKGYLKSIPVDPFGEEYYIEKNSDLIMSHKGGRGLKFHGKTAKTGIAKQEGWVSNEE